MKKENSHPLTTSKDPVVSNKSASTSYPSLEISLQMMKLNVIPSTLGYSNLDLPDSLVKQEQPHMTKEQPDSPQQERTHSTSRQLVYDRAYLHIASVVSSLSYDKKIRVGSAIVRDGQILSQGWNGQPTGHPNDTRDKLGVTLPTVIHSEANALMKLAKNGGGSNGATIYCTHSPCMDCALLILQSGITRIVYSEVYCEDALSFLEERGLQIECITRSDRLHPEQGTDCQCE